MSKKTFFLVLAFLLIVSGFFGWYFFLRTGDITPQTETPITSPTDLFPFGQNSSSDSQTGTGILVDISSSTAEVGEINSATGLPRLRQISKTPAAGAIVFDMGSSTLIRYIERATGHIYETNNVSAQIKKISSVTIPKVYESLWSNDGSKVILRYLKGEEETIKTFYATISALNAPEEALEGTFLQDNIQNITSLGTKIYYTLKTSAGSSGITANMDGSEKTSVFSSSFSDWTSRWSSPTLITIYPRPAGSVMSAAYLLNTTNGTYTKAGNDLNGLSALANIDGTFVFLSYTSGNSIKSAIYNTKTFTTENTGIVALADKCVWSVKNKNIIYCASPTTLASGTFPDDWYKGKVSFSDTLWKIDVSTGETNEIFNPLFEVSRSMDITNLNLNQSETVLVFKNKKDQTVWRYELTE